MRRAALAGALARNVAVYSLFVLCCANLIGGAGCYALEYANRVAFLERRRLSEVALARRAYRTAEPCRPRRAGA